MLAIRKLSRMVPVAYSTKGEVAQEEETEDEVEGRSEERNSKVEDRRVEEKNKDKASSEVRIINER